MCVCVCVCVCVCACVTNIEYLKHRKVCPSALILRMLIVRKVTK